MISSSCCFPETPGTPKKIYSQIFLPPTSCTAQSVLNVLIQNTRYYTLKRHNLRQNKTKTKTKTKQKTTLKSPSISKAKVYKIVANTVADTHYWMLSVPGAKSLRQYTSIHYMSLCIQSPFSCDSSRLTLKNFEYCLNCENAPKYLE